MPSCESGFAGLLDVGPRGWAMRHGHKKRLARETGRESRRGRATFARSVNKVCFRWDRYSERQERCQLRKNEKSAWQRDCQRLVKSGHEEECWEALEALDALDASGSVACISPCEQDVNLYVEAKCRELDVETASTRTPDPQESETEEEEEEEEEECLAPPLLRQRSTPTTQLELREAVCCTERQQRLPLAAWAAVLGLGLEGRAEDREARPPSRWELAEAKARKARQASGCSAATTSSIRKRGKKPQRPAVTPAAPQPQGTVQFPRVAVVGRPYAPQEHDAVLRLVQEGRSTEGLPSWWSGGNTLVTLKKDTEEYKLIEDYLVACLASRVSDVVGVSRVQIGGAYRQWPGGKPTVMFHGCKTAANEEGILRQGFQVSKCHSGGSNFGTWFAYDANYSNSGFAYHNTNTGERHLFVCVVSDNNVRLDNNTMRVVAQGCAYPQWLVRYTVPQVVHTLPKVKPQPGDFYIVHNGRWVLERHVTGGR